MRFTYHLHIVTCESCVVYILITYISMYMLCHWHVICIYSCLINDKHLHDSTITIYSYSIIQWYTSKAIYIHRYIHTCIYTFMCVDCIYIYIYVYAYIYVCMYMYDNNMYMHVYICKYIEKYAEYTMHH